MDLVKKAIKDMVQEELKADLEQKINIRLLHMAEPDSVEAVVDIALYGLFAMIAAHNKTGREQAVLQVMAGHLRKILEVLPKTESLVETEKNYRKLEDVIFKTYLPKQ